MKSGNYFLTLILSGLLLPGVSLAVPLHPQTVAQLRTLGQLDQAVALHRQAQERGLDLPTERPLQVQNLGRVDLQVLTLLVDFSDNQANPSVHPPEWYENLLYSINTYPSGSLRDYYLENSYDQVHIVGEASGWYRMPQPYSYYTYNQFGMGPYPNNTQKMTEDAVAAADPYVDFSIYDNDLDGYVDAVFVVHAGPGGENTGNPDDIWSHAWVTHNVPYVDGVSVYSYSTEPENGNIGVFGHELGHALFGLPDLYDYDYDSEGTGMWSMMSGGCWGFGGTMPVHLDAWSKVRANFTAAANVPFDQTGVAIPQVEESPIIYRLWTQAGVGMQYFLVENRQQIGFDAALPFGGLLIYHIEEESGNNSHQWYPGYTSNGHYLVAVEQADGDWDLEQSHNSGDNGDPYPGAVNQTTFDVGTTPDTRDYNFQPTQVAVRNIANMGSVAYADFEVGIPTGGVDVVLLPDNPPIVIPAIGGSFGYTGVVTNHDSTLAQTQFWVKVYLPDGSLYGTLFGPFTLTINGNQYLSGVRIQNVPDWAPAGVYDLVGCIGVYPNVADSSFFNVTKEAAGDAASLRTDNWTNTGEEFEVGGTRFVASNGPERDMTTHVPPRISPNPFNPSTAFSFELRAASYVSLRVYDTAGRLVETLVDGWRTAGEHQVTFDGSGLASGVYLYRLQAEEHHTAGKMVLLK